MSRPSGTAWGPRCLGIEMRHFTKNDMPSAAIMRVLTLAALAAATASAPAHAQAPAPHDLPAVIRTALATHPSLRGAGAQLDAARAQLRQARAGYAPHLGASLGYTRYPDDPSFSVPGLGTLVFGEKENKQASLAVQVPLFTGGRLEGTTRQARAGVTGSESALARQRQRVVLDATTAYYNVLKARGLVRVAADQLQALQSQRDAIARMRERGVATQIDLLRAETAVSSAQEGVIRARNGGSVAIAALANAMGLPADPKLVVIETASGSSAPPLPGDEAAAAAEALRLRPELRQAEAGREAAQAGVQTARSGGRPSLGLYAQYDATRPTTMPRTGNWSAGAALTMNLFDAGATRADVARARAQVTQAEASRDELHNAITLQVTQALLNVESARERVTTTEKGATTADEGVRLVRLGYQNGVNTITDFLAAQAEQARAQTDHVNALFDLRLAEAELRFALGREP
jgi:outer membrane protein